MFGDHRKFHDFSNQIIHLVNEDISEENEENSRSGGHYLMSRQAPVWINEPNP